MKCSHRLYKMVEDINLYRVNKTGVGPMYGLLSHALVLGIVIDVQDHKIILGTPLGVKVDICTPYTTHYKAILRDACRFAILKQLADRLENESGKKRKDMEGITLFVDHQATMAMLRV